MRDAMKRVRGKKTVEKNLQCVTRSQKKRLREESDENDPFRMITLDLKMEILIKLPAKSIAKLSFVSNPLSSMIRGKQFTDLYMARSSTRPRLLFRAHRDGKHFFHSYPQENPYYDHHEPVSIALNPKLYYAFSPSIRGLICGQNDSKVLIGNPSTGQFITLPRILGTKGVSIVSFLGYEPVNDVYKVLCILTRGSRQEYQVFTLGGKEKEWRMIKCKHPHVATYSRKGSCMNGVVYYYAWMKSYWALISFDLRSEEFNVIKLRVDVLFLGELSDLMNYCGKIALIMYLTGTYELRILEDGIKQEWSKVSFLIPSWGDLVGSYEFSCKGALSTGEIIFAPYSDINVNPFYFICYDLKENIAKKVVVQGIRDNLAKIEIFLNHVDNPMVLSNVS